MTISDRKEREKKMRRKNIIDTAEELFFKRGYENITMADIAEGAELARSTLYLYFKNKKEIYLAISFRSTELLNKMLKKNYEKGETGLEKVKMLMNAFYEFYEEYPDYYDVNWASYKCSIDHDLPEMEEMKNMRVKGFSLFQKALQTGIEDKSIRSDLDPVKANLVLASSIQNVFNLPPTIRLHLKNNNLTHEELIDYTVDMMVHSIK
ncbi:TetR/AcrR family transcriptional regulator [Methanobacterium petrolearium]|uniref:TetR/AcrR family transcriptional regulator n=1 Tax=Methanobacterium petrolearium TaxID=710190 RepID=UPI001AEA3E20|nr:TetR/AcrR family transcriptional regulator [Methanobacterium petrolearium]MBP1945562.1 AcrR family transcriptional regulator [Methanobacterium petrolearium]